MGFEKIHKSHPFKSHPLRFKKTCDPPRTSLGKMGSTWFDQIHFSRLIVDRWTAQPQTVTSFSQNEPNFRIKAHFKSSGFLNSFLSLSSFAKVSDTDSFFCKHAIFFFYVVFPLDNGLSFSFSQVTHQNSNGDSA